VEQQIQRPIQRDAELLFEARQFVEVNRPPHPPRNEPRGLVSKHLRHTRAAPDIAPVTGPRDQKTRLGIDHTRRSPHTLFTVLRLLQDKTYFTCELPVPLIGPNYGSCGLTARLDTTAEQIKRNYTTTVSQMRCPYHHKSAWVEVEDEELNACQVDIVTCCQEFEQRVRKLLINPA
jgi:hypothetical protein